MHRANLIEQQGNDATIAAVARTMDVPLDLRPPSPQASRQMYFAVAVGWLARFGVWWGPLRKRISVSRGEPINTGNELTINDSASVTAHGKSPTRSPSPSRTSQAKK